MFGPGCWFGDGTPTSGSPAIRLRNAGISPNAALGSAAREYFRTLLALAASLINRLSYWVGIATALCLAAGVLVVGVGFVTLFALLHVPFVLALLLLLRAIVLRVRGESPALEWRGRPVLAGTAAIAVPAVFLVVWVVARETGVVKAELCSKVAQHSISSLWGQWEERVPERVIEASGLQVKAPDGVFGDAFRDALRGVWVAGDGSQLHGDVTIAYDPPFAGWPLYKTVELNSRVTALLQLHRADAGQPRSSNVTMDIEGTWTAVGLTSHRDFRTWLGRELGGLVRKIVDERVRDATKKK